jgi:NADPH-dependent curcumin reductase CurA
MSDENHQVRLAQRPEGLPAPEVWEHTTEPIPEPGDGQVVVEVEYVSLDPAMRGWMNDVPSYIPPVGLGEVMRAGGVGKVIASKSDRFAEGDYVSGMTGAQEYVALDARGVTPADTSIAPAPTWLGALGMTGLTAYFGLLDVGEPKEGDTVVVSGAAGAVGSIVGQIAKLKGCRVVGIAGGPEKCEWIVEELGFDVAIDYKNEDVGKALRAAAPDRVDVYFDNVGGDILEAVLGRLNLHARVVICGAISGYNEAAPAALQNYLALLVFRARMQGFIIFDYAKRYGEGVKALAGWYGDGKLVAREEVVDGGIQAFGDTLNLLFKGENTGKLVLRVA